MCGVWFFQRDESPPPTEDAKPSPNTTPVCTTNLINMACSTKVVFEY